MPEVFTNAKSVLGITETPIYTCPADTKAIIIGCQVTQTDIDLRELDLYWKDASDGDTVAYLGKTIKVPPEVSYNPIGGKVVLEGGDSLCGICDTASFMHLSLFILEIS